MPALGGCPPSRRINRPALGWRIPIPFPLRELPWWALDSNRRLMPFFCADSTPVACGRRRPSFQGRIGQGATPLSAGVNDGKRCTVHSMYCSPSKQQLRYEEPSTPSACKELDVTAVLSFDGCFFTPSARKSKPNTPAVLPRFQIASLDELHSRYRHCMEFGSERRCASQVGLRYLQSIPGDQMPGRRKLVHGFRGSPPLSCMHLIPPSTPPSPRQEQPSRPGGTRGQNEECIRARPTAWVEFPLPDQVPRRHSSWAGDDLASSRRLAVVEGRSGLPFTWRTETTRGSSFGALMRSLLCVHLRVKGMQPSRSTEPACGGGRLVS